MGAVDPGQIKKAPCLLSRSSFGFFLRQRLTICLRLSLELTAIFLPQLLKCWDDRNAQSHLPDSPYSWVLSSMLVLPHLSCLQLQASLRGAHGAEGWKDALEASPLGPLKIGAPGDSRDRSEAQGLTQWRLGLRHGIHLPSKLPVIFHPVWNPPVSVSRVLAQAFSPSLGSSALPRFAAHWRLPAFLGSWSLPCITSVLSAVITTLFLSWTLKPFFCKDAYDDAGAQREDLRQTSHQRDP